MDIIQIIIVVFIAAIVFDKVWKLFTRKKKKPKNEKYQVTVFLPEGQVREYGQEMVKRVELRDRYVLIEFHDGREIEFERVTCIVETTPDPIE